VPDIRHLPSEQMDLAINYSRGSRHAGEGFSH
jgi:hypothetical protein